jgi:hypothetical protein
VLLVLVAAVKSLDTQEHRNEAACHLQLKDLLITLSLEVKLPSSVHTFTFLRSRTYLSRAVSHENYHSIHRARWKIGISKSMFALNQLNGERAAWKKVVE